MAAPVDTNGKITAAHRGSRELSYLSTAQYVSGLNFRVRNGSGCVPAALAAMTEAVPAPEKSQGPDLNRSVVALQATAWPLRHLGLYVRLIL
jgi:hypothetical protein